MNTKLIAISILSAAVTTVIVSGETGRPASSTPIQTGNPPSPKELTTTRCLICHGDSIAGQDRLAPPFAMVKMHYDFLDEKPFIKAVSSWIKEPHERKSQMPGAIRRFGIMPALPYPEADLVAIAKYVYETDFKMPGEGGPGRGKGRGKGRGREGKGSGSGNQTVTKAEAGLRKASASCRTTATKTQSEGNPGKGCAACRSKASSSSAKPVEKTLPTAANFQQWTIPSPMMIHLRNLEEDITAFETKAAKRHAALANRIDKDLTQFISSCTMKGAGLDALHEWLVPFREMARQQAESTDPAAQMKLVHDMRRAITEFHEQFESGTQPATPRRNRK